MSKFNATYSYNRMIMFWCIHCTRLGPEHPPNATRKCCRSQIFSGMFPYRVPLFLPFVLPRLLSKLAWIPEDPGRSNIRVELAEHLRKRGHGLLFEGLAAKRQCVAISDESGLYRTDLALDDKQSFIIILSLYYHLCRRFVSGHPVSSSIHRKGPAQLWSCVEAIPSKASAAWWTASRRRISDFTRPRPRVLPCGKGGRGGKASAS